MTCFAISIPQSFYYEQNSSAMREGRRDGAVRGKGGRREGEIKGKEPFIKHEIMSLFSFTKWG